MWPPMCRRSQMRASTFWVAFTCTRARPTAQCQHKTSSSALACIAVGCPECRCLPYLCALLQNTSSCHLGALWKQVGLRACNHAHTTLMLTPQLLTSRRSVLLLISPAFMALMVLLVNKSKAAATCPSSASPARLMRAKLSLIRINASSCLQAANNKRVSEDAAVLADNPGLCRSLASHTVCVVSCRILSGMTTARP